jgi:IclR family acetate operon transcriptional repressor
LSGAHSEGVAMPGSRRDPRPPDPAAPPTATRSGRLVAVDRTLPIVKELGRHPRGIALDQLARDTGLPKSTLHGMLASLCHAGFAEQDELGRYRIGLEFLRVAFEFHETRDAYDLVYPALDAIARRFGEPAFFAQLDGAEIVYSAIAEPPSAAFRAFARIGGRKPAFCTALGKAILAYTLADDTGAHDFIAQYGPLERRTPNSIVTRASFAAELANVREQGFATDSEEGEVGLNCLAFPVFLESRTVPAGAISVAAFASRTPLEALVDARHEMREIVERHLGPVVSPEPVSRLAGEHVARAHEPRSLQHARPAAGPAEAGTIVSIEALPVSVGAHARTLVHLTTSEGLTGVGEATSRESTEVVVAAIRELTRTLKDEDASRTAHLLRMLERPGGAGATGPERTAAIAGIEQALWDVKAKVLGVPVYELLGGRAREWIDLYASAASGLARAEILDWVASAVADGFGSVLLRPLRADGPRSGASVTGEVAAIVEAARAGVGDGVRLAVDLEGRLSPSAALAVARAIEGADVWFLAGAARPGDGETLRAIREGTALELAADGDVASARGTISVVDLVGCGGVLAARRLAAAMDASGGTVVLRSDLTPVTTMACAQLAMATPNIVALEWRVDDVLWRDKLVSEAPTPRDGRLWVGRGPGLGVAPDLEHCHAHPYTPRPVRTPRRSDGSLA